MIVHLTNFSPVILNLFHDLSNKISVNQQLALAGLASHISSAGIYSDAIEMAIRNAKAQHLGIYSDKCQSRVPLDPKCDIKGNIDQSSGIKFYHLPGCLHYQEALINIALGEKWFCTELEAEKAGFQKAAGCKN